MSILHCSNYSIVSVVQTLDSKVYECHYIYHARLLTRIVGHFHILSSPLCKLFYIKLIEVIEVIEIIKVKTVKK